MRGRQLLLVCCVLASSCTSYEPDRRSVLWIDVCSSEPAAQPLDVEQAAKDAGCSYAVGGGVTELVVEAVTTPREFVVRSKYGVERLRPWFDAATLAALQQLGGQQQEDLWARMGKTLVGRRLFEPDSVWEPSVSADGVRIAALYTPDLEPLDELVCSEMDDLSDSTATVPAAVDLTPVERDPATLQAHVAIAIREAEQFSSFRLPAGLEVRWTTYGEMPQLSSPIYDTWRELVGKCFDEDGGPIVEVDPSWYAESVPGGRVFVLADHDWREFELHYALLHELVHQHDFTLCVEGRLPLRNLPKPLWEAHASAVAREILRRAGASEAELALARDWDQYSVLVQPFDEFRTQLGLSPDEYITYLVDHPDEARRLVRGALFTADGCIDSGPLAFEYVGRSDRGQAIVAVVNTSEHSFSGYFNGWWHLITQSSHGRERSTGGTPFTLCLPAGGRVTLETQQMVEANDEVVACHAAYRETPAPVFKSTTP